MANKDLSGKQLKPDTSVIVGRPADEINPKPTKTYEEIMAEVAKLKAEEK